MFATPLGQNLHFALKVCKIERQFCVLAETCDKSRREKVWPKSKRFSRDVESTLRMGRQNGLHITVFVGSIATFLGIVRFSRDVCPPFRIRRSSGWCGGRVADHNRNPTAQGFREHVEPRTRKHMFRLCPQDLYQRIHDTYTLYGNTIRKHDTKTQYG